MAMVELDQMKFELQSYENTLHEVKDSLDLEGKKKRIEELEMEMEAPGFWDDPDSSNRKMKELKNLKDTAELCNKLETQYSDIETLIEMGHEEEDPDMVEEIRGELDEFIEELDELRISTLLSGEYDKDNAILKLNAGAGGTESCDWCGMLYRMYTRWAEKKGFSVEVLDYLDGEEAGIKSVTFQVNGENAYGYLKSEKAYTVLSGFPPSTPRASARPPSYLWMLCRISKKIWISRLTRKICALIPTEAAVQAVSISTRPLLRSVSRICRQVSWYSVRMNVLSSRTRIRRCRC